MMGPNGLATALVAQWIEQEPSNLLVAGSIPAEGALVGRGVMENIQLEFLAREFLAAYEAKDLQTISSKLAEGVVVKDWNLEVVGKTQVLREFAKNFEEASSLSIQIVQLHSSENAVAAELEIKVNEIEILHVVDVITFAENNEITSIVSYKGL
jgi:hypothetical protein